MAIKSVKNKTRSGSLLVGNPFFSPPSYESIATATVGSGGTASITFSSIPSIYKHLQIRGILQSARATFSRDEYKIIVNSDTGANYAWHNIYGSGTSIQSGNEINRAYILGQDVVGANGWWGATVVDFLDYTNTNKNKTVRILAGLDTNGAGVSGANGAMTFSSGLWRNTNAITSITFTATSANWNQYTQLALYGIKE
jgi:hypothetical protein